MYVADGIGIFGQPRGDVVATTGDNYVHNLTIPSAGALYGVSAVFRILADDPIYPFPECFTLSNPVVVNL